MDKSRHPSKITTYNKDEDDGGPYGDIVRITRKYSDSFTLKATCSEVFTHKTLAHDHFILKPSSDSLVFNPNLRNPIEYKTADCVADVVVDNRIDGAHPQEK